MWSHWVWSQVCYDLKEVTVDAGNNVGGMNHFTFPCPNCRFCQLKESHVDSFSFNVHDNRVTITRLDVDGGWDAVVILTCHAIDFESCISKAESRLTKAKKEGDNESVKKAEQAVAANKAEQAEQATQTCTNYNPQSKAGDKAWFSNFGTSLSPPPRNEEQLNFACDYLHEKYKCGWKHINPGGKLGGGRQNCCKCGGGVYPKKNRLCNACGPGKFARSQNEPCIDCPTGTFSSDDANAQCQKLDSKGPCPAGKERIGNRCMQCSDGKYSSSPGQKCKRCSQVTAQRKSYSELEQERRSVGPNSQHLVFEYKTVSSGATYCCPMGNNGAAVGVVC